MYMEKLLKENIQPAIRASSPALKMFTFTKVHFGNTVSFPNRESNLKTRTCLLKAESGFLLTSSPFTAASPDHRDESIHARSGSKGGGSGPEH